jgi:hypothetical protein
MVVIEVSIAEVYICGSTVLVFYVCFEEVKHRLSHVQN